MDFRLLGPLEVEEAGRPLPLGSAKQRALLALLVLYANEVVSRDRLADELWDGGPQETAPTARQAHVSQLRKLLGRDVVVTRAPGYVLAVDPEQIDLVRFERLVDEAKAAENAELSRARL